MSFTPDSNFEKVNENINLQVGDIIWIKFKIVPGWLYVKAAGIASIESKLEKYPNYQILSTNYVDDPDYVWYKIQIVNPDNSEELQTAGVGAAIVIAAFLLATTIYFSFSKTADIYKYKRDTAIALSSNPELVSEVITTVNETEAAQTQTVGTQVQKAGIGIAIPIIAVGVILYLWKRR